MNEIEKILLLHIIDNRLHLNKLLKESTAHVFTRSKVSTIIAKFWIPGLSKTCRLFGNVFRSTKGDLPDSSLQACQCSCQNPVSKSLANYLADIEGGGLTFLKGGSSDSMMLMNLERTKIC